MRDRDRVTRGDTPGHGLLYRPIIYLLPCTSIFRTKLKTSSASRPRVVPWTPPLGALRTSWISESLLTANCKTDWLPARMTVTAVSVCIYHFTKPKHFRLSTYQTRHRLTICVICLHPYTTIFYTAKHDGTVKGQYATLMPKTWQKI